MYRYDFDNENILLESVNNLICINEIELRGNILITDKNILIFKNIKAGSILASRGIFEMPEYELVIKIDLNNFKYIIEGNNTIINYKHDEIILFDIDVNNVKN